MTARAKLRACFPDLPAGTSNDLIERAVDEILGDHTRELAEMLRTKAEQLAILRSEDARLRAEGLRMGADMIDAEAEGQS